jgi:hypothetical protein
MAKKAQKKKLHWTQRPENKDKVALLGRKRWNKMNVKGHNSHTPTNLFVKQLNKLRTDALVRMNAIDEEIQKLQAEKQELESHFPIER